MIRLATETDIPAIKVIADKNRAAIGFVNRASLLESIQRQQLFVAELWGEIVGFCNCWVRLDGWTTVREICIDEPFRGLGLAQQMITELDKPIRLKCPVDNASNNFYVRMGFTLKEILPGKNRQLNLWTLT